VVLDRQPASAAAPPEEGVSQSIHGVLAISNNSGASDTDL
jgi:hypothetical protein